MCGTKVSGVALEKAIGYFVRVGESYPTGSKFGRSVIDWNLELGDKGASRRFRRNRSLL